MTCVDATVYCRDTHLGVNSPCNTSSHTACASCHATHLARSQTMNPKHVPSSVSAELRSPSGLARPSARVASLRSAATRRLAPVLWTVACLDWDSH